MAPVAKSTTFVRVPGERELDTIGTEIDLVIEAEIPTLLPASSKEQRSKISEALRANPNRTYLWLCLTLNVIKDRLAALTSTQDFLDVIDKLPSTLWDAYTAILNRSPDQKKVRILLQLVYAAKRPMTVMEVDILLAIACRPNISLEQHANLVPQSSLAATVSLKNICGLLLTVSHGKLLFIHETAREFIGDLSPDKVNAGNQWHHCAPSSVAYTIEGACMVLLNLIDLKAADDFFFVETRHPYPWTRGRVIERVRDSLARRYPDLPFSLFEYAAEALGVPTSPVGRAGSGLEWLQPRTDDYSRTLSRGVLDSTQPSCAFWISHALVHGYDIIPVPFTRTFIALLAGNKEALHDLLDSDADVNGPTEHSVPREPHNFGSLVIVAAQYDWQARVAWLMDKGAVGPRSVAKLAVLSGSPDTTRACCSC